MKLLNRPKDISTTAYALLKEHSIQSKEFRFLGHELTLIPEQDDSKYSVRAFDETNLQVWWLAVNCSLEGALLAVIRFVEDESAKLLYPNGTNEK